MDGHFDQRSPEDSPANAQREYQASFFSPEQSPPAPKITAPEAASMPSVPDERKASVGDAEQMSDSVSRQSDASSTFDSVPVSEPTPEVDDGTGTESEPQGFQKIPLGMTYNDFHDRVENLYQANNLEHNEYHQHGERLRITDITADDLDGKSRDRFVKPDRVAKIESELFMGERQVALLTIEEGGRNTTARFLASAGNQKTRRIHPPAELTFEPWQLREYSNSAFLLDLSDVEIENPELLLENLSGLGETLRRQGSFLVVVFGQKDLTTAQCGQFGVISVGRPNPYEILRKHLDDTTSAPKQSDDSARTAENLALSVAAAQSSEQKRSGYTGTPAQWVEFARSRGLLDRKPPAEAVRLRKAITEALDLWNNLTPAGQSSLKDEFKNRRHIPRSDDDSVYAEQLVLDRFQAWVTELDLWNHDNQNNPRLRAFQLATAVVPTGDPIRIRTEATALLQTITRAQFKEAKIDEKHISDPALVEPVLTGPGTRLLARDSLAELQDGKVVFPRPGFAEAVVRYFWNDWPEHRSALIDWLMNLSTSDTFTPEEQEDLKNQVGEFAIHHAQERGEFGFLYDVIAKWAGVEATLPDAAKLLEQAATTSGIAGAVRDRTRQWSQQKSDPALRRIVAELCARPTFALEHPRLVTTRLVHLMERRQDGHEESGLDAALERASRLLSTAADQSSAVLTRLSVDARAEHPEQRKRAVRLFLSMAQARVGESSMPALIPKSERPQSNRTALIALWASALRVLKDDEAKLQPAFNAWMDACAPSDVEREVIGVVRDAIADRWDEAGEADHVLARLSGRWKAVTQLPLARATELDQRLLAASRDAMLEITNKTFPGQRAEHE